MDVKLRDLINSKTALLALNSITFKALYGFKVKKIVEAVNNEMKHFEEELKEKQKVLFEGIPEGEKPDEEKIESFNEEMEEAIDQTVSLNIKPVNLSWFAKTNGAINDNTEWHDFTPANFQALGWLIECDID